MGTDSDSDRSASGVDFVDIFPAYRSACIGQMSSVLRRYSLRPNRINPSFLEEVRQAVEHVERLEPIYGMLNVSEREIIDSVNNKIRPLVDY